MSQGRSDYGYFDLINCTILPKRDGGTIPECYFPQEFKGMISKFNTKHAEKTRWLSVDFNQWKHGMGHGKVIGLSYENHTRGGSSGGVAIIPCTAAVQLIIKKKIKNIFIYFLTSENKSREEESGKSEPLQLALLVMFV